MSLDRETLKRELKEMIAVECDTDCGPQEIDDDIQLIGGGLDLDSLDALQICMAVKKKYGVRIEAGPEARNALRSVNTLADAVMAKPS